MPTSVLSHTAKIRNNDIVVSYIENGKKYVFAFRSIMKARSVYDELRADPATRSVKISKAEVNNGITTYRRV